MAWDEYVLFSDVQSAGFIFSKTSYVSFGGEMLRDATRVFYICLLRWNPDDRAPRLRFLVRCLTFSFFMSILFTAIEWSPFYLKSIGPLMVDLDEYAKKYHLPELWPEHML